MLCGVVSAKCMVVELYVVCDVCWFFEGVVLKRSDMLI